MIDVEKITKAFSEIPIESDEAGLIPAFGVYLTKIFGDYYSEISFEFEKLFAEEVDDPAVMEAARQLLIEAGHVCGFNTFGGIMKSEEWDALVCPMVETKEDWIRAMVAVINVLGWGVYSIEELSEDKLELCIVNSYESDAYLRLYGPTAKHGVCYLGVGASISMMSLVYDADISQKPELNEELYEKLFKHDRKYEGVETECMGKGDSCCRIVITRH